MLQDAARKEKPESRFQQRLPAKAIRIGRPTFVAPVLHELRRQTGGFGCERENLPKVETAVE